jgi:hypothetical protein
MSLGSQNTSSFFIPLGKVSRYHMALLLQSSAFVSVFFSDQIVPQFPGPQNAIIFHKKNTSGF